jgi:FtsP/CotA-like multicopper oxidase with cupredoxin domain
MHRRPSCFVTLTACLFVAAPVVAQQLAPANSVQQPEGWDAGLALPQVVDLNPDPAILEFNLEASITNMEIMTGKQTPVWSYNGGLPGPLIELNVGDRLIVHFTNNLPEATTIHWHGMRVPNAMDGAPGYTQEPIAANGGTFTYDYVVQDAGTFWYHPHSNSAAQVGWGLYGPMVVRDPNERNDFGDELVLLLSDMSLDAEGQFLPVDVGGAFGDLFGREGSILLVNGKVKPTLKVRQRKQQRWRVINAARSRYYTLRYKREPLLKLGGDNGFAERTQVVDQIKLVPDERADFVFTPTDAPGTQTRFRWYPTDRGYGSTFNRFAEDMMFIDTVDAPAVQPLALADGMPLREIVPIDTTDATEREVSLTIEMKGDNTVEMGINGIPHHKAKPLVAHVGDTEVWTVKNDTDFSHPFHLHGFFFQVLDATRVPEWKDTVDVPSKTELKLAVRYDERPGMWMYHCHILDHAEIGMMGHLQVLPAGVEAGETAAAGSHDRH